MEKAVPASAEQPRRRSIPPESYKGAWTRLRLDDHASSRRWSGTAESFDPGAKFRIPGTTPYMRYFLANILMFQFYKAACCEAGWTGPLHRCSFHGDKAVGRKLEAFTGSREMSGRSIIACFAPPHAWLREQNAGRVCGW